MTAQASERELLALADECMGFHDAASGDAQGGDGQFDLLCCSGSLEQRLNLRAVLRQSAAALRLAATRAAGDAPAWLEPTNSQLNSACMSYRHDFGLLDATAQQTMRWKAKEWLIAWRKEGFGCDRNEVIERCAAVVDQCNKEGPYHAIAAAPRIRSLKGDATPRPDRGTPT